MKLFKKGDFAWQHLMIILLALTLLFFVIFYYKQIGAQIKEGLKNIFGGFLGG